MQAGVRLLLAGAVICMTTGCYGTRQKIGKTVAGVGNRAEFRGTAGAGFAGVRLSEVLQLPAGSGDSQAADSVDLVENRRVSWRPAISTGLQVMFYSLTESQAGAGLGTHIVFVPDASGRTSPFPSITAHFGNPSHQVFIGALFMPSDRVRFPNGEGQYRMERPADDAFPDFVLENNRAWHYKRPTLYMGLEIAGGRISERDAEIAAEASSRTAAVSLEVEAAVTVKVNGLHQLKPRVLDKEKESVPARVTYGSSDLAVASVTPDGIIRGIKDGDTTITVNAAGLTRQVAVKVKAADGAGS